MIALSFSSDMVTIRKNRDLLKEERERLSGELKVVDAMAKANRELCKHPNSRSYFSYGESCWSCEDCGGQG